eukprot:TRINITY_DN3960_c0_g1_i1.p1 TRINITY_DN3960_c0_g1~~TRINITY_DN3960_c0_g1_i1.p1  ORF type:complete len:273 (-),score=34.34 TRINITY_DN3960_c0_g1_i1:340-1077(-)
MAEGYPQKIHVDPTSGAASFSAKIKVDRGLSWERAKAAWDTYQQEDYASKRRENGFWVSTYSDNIGGTKRPLVLLATEILMDSKTWRAQQMYRIRKPNNSTSLNLKLEAIAQNYRKVTEKEAEKVWKFWYEFTLTECMHGKKCKIRELGNVCQYGMRMEVHRLVTGAVLPIWRKLCYVAKTLGADKRELRIVRAQLDSGEMLVGAEVTETELRKLVEICADPHPVYDDDDPSRPDDSSGPDDVSD